MRARLRSPRELFARLQTSVSHTTAGGSWAIQLPAEVQHNLRWFFWDGVLAAASDAIFLTYQTLYILALGASNAQIGLMSALSNLSATVMLMPGAILADRFKRRKSLVLWAGGGISRVTLLLLALLPFAFAGQGAVYVAIGLNILMAGFGNLALPAWVSLTGDIIPLTWRGRYFGTRNLIMGMASMVTILIVGQLITRLGASIPVYQAAFGVCFLIGMLSTYSYAHIREPESRSSAGTQAYKLKALLRTLQGDPNFLIYCLYTMLWNFSLNVAGPFFTVYQVQSLKASAFMIGLVSIVSSLSGLPGQRIFGQLADRWGPRRVMVVTGWLIPLMPFMWFFTRAAWHAIPINLLAGFLWAGYGLASFNFLLAISTDENRARYSAMAQIAVAVSAAAGAAVGGVVASRWGIPVVFLISGVGRVLAAGVVARFVKATPGSEQQPTSPDQPPVTSRAQPPALSNQPSKSGAELPAAPEQELTTTGEISTESLETSEGNELPPVIHADTPSPKDPPSAVSREQESTES